MDRLHGGEGPLSTFYAKIELAYALGLISDMDRLDLHVIRSVRSDFAHTASLIKFDTPEVKKKCSSLKPRGNLPKDIQEKVHSGNAKLHFTHTVLHLQFEIACKGENLATQEIERLREQLRLLGG